MNPDLESEAQRMKQKCGEKLHIFSSEPLFENSVQVCDVTLALFLFINHKADGSQIHHQIFYHCNLDISFMGD